MPRARPSRTFTIMLYVTLAVCTVLAALLVYRYDLYDREPWYMALMAVALGALAMFGLSELETWTLINVMGQITPVPIAIVASTHEEAARLLIVFLIAIVATKQFNDPLDGLVYGSLVGLGMAVTESILVLGELSNGLTALPPSELVRLLGHLVLGGITGYAIGPARMGHSGWGYWLVGCVVFTTAWHFVWDWIAFTALFRGSMEVRETVLGMVLMLMGMLVYGALVVVGSERSRDTFAPGSKRRVWGWPFTLLTRR